MRVHNEVDSFMKSQKRKGSYGTERMSNDWKKDGHITIVLSRKRFAVEILQHKFPKLVEFAAKDGRRAERKYWTEDLVCHEHEDNFEKRYYRNQDGTREHPPQHCPLCKLQEWVFQAVMNEDLALSDVVFAFDDATANADNRVLTAAGIAAIDQLARSKAGIPDYLAEAFGKIPQSKLYQQHMMAKNNYILTAADYDDPEDGLKVFPVAFSAGKGIVTLLNKSVQNDGEAGDFISHDPQPIVITYDKDEIPTNMYSVMLANAKTRPMTKAHLAVIDQEPPEFGREYEPFEFAPLRAFLEKHARIDMPFDEFFGEGKSATSFDFGANSKNEKLLPQGATEVNNGLAAALSDGIKRGLKQNEKQNAPAPATRPKAHEMISCDECGKLMRDDEEKCPHCGAEYDLGPAV